MCADLHGKLFTQIFTVYAKNNIYADSDDEINRFIIKYLAVILKNNVFCHEMVLFQSL